MPWRPINPRQKPRLQSRATDTGVVQLHPRQRAVTVVRLGQRVHASAGQVSDRLLGFQHGLLGQQLGFRAFQFFTGIGGGVIEPTRHPFCARISICLDAVQRRRARLEQPTASSNGHPLLERQRARPLGLAGAMHGLAPERRAAQARARCPASRWDEGLGVRQLLA